MVSKGARRRSPASRPSPSRGAWAERRASVRFEPPKEDTGGRLGQEDCHALDACPQEEDREAPVGERGVLVGEPVEDEEQQQGRAQG